MSRSSMVHAAKRAIPSRFELIRTAAKLARLIHVPNQERMADTISRALLEISGMERQETTSTVTTTEPADSGRRLDQDTQPAEEIFSVGQDGGK